MKTLILYHANCPDGFGGAYAAWKKLGDTATYIAVERHFTLPADIDGADVTCIDFCYPEHVLNELRSRAASVMVLDHHLSNAAVVTAEPAWVYSAEHSGCWLAWKHFHPDVPLPLLLQYVEEADVWRYTLPDSALIQRWIHMQPASFVGWDAAVKEFEQPARLARITEKARSYEEYFQSLLRTYEEQAQPVEMDGHRILAVQAPGFLRSDLGHVLATKRPPFALVWRYQDNGIRCSLRGDGSIDLSEIAAHHGGGGHRNAASFFVPARLPLPFTPIND
jgi:oligoribonuclease NrnB/cAMP/cGMP phosphodiesterase (DHH superfamily)